MFDLHDAAGVMGEIARVARRIPITTSASTPSIPRKGVESVALSFIVNRPAEEPGFCLDPHRGSGRARRLHASTPMRVGPRTLRVLAMSPTTRQRETRDEPDGASGRRAGGADELRRPRRRVRAGRHRQRSSTSSIATSSGSMPVKRRVREIAALLLVERVRERAACRRTAFPTHVLHRQPGHRQDDGRSPDGRDPPPPGLRAKGPRRRRHARRSRRPVHRAHGAQDQGSPQEGHGRRALHRRGLLPLPAREREGLRQEAIEILLQVMENQRDDLVVILAGYKDRMDALLRQQPRRRVARRASRRVPRLRVDGELLEIAEKMLADWNYRFDDEGRRRSRSTSRSA